MTELKIPTDRRWSIIYLQPWLRSWTRNDREQIQLAISVGLGSGPLEFESSAPTAWPSCLPQGVGEEAKKESGSTERGKEIPFFPSAFLPSLSPFAQASQATTAYICLILSPLMNSLLLLSRTGFINRFVVAQLLSILWSPLFLKHLYIQWSILCPTVNHPNKKKLLLHCMDSLMPRSCQCSLPISRYVLYFLCYDRAGQSFRIIDKSLDWLALL